MSWQRLNNIDLLRDSVEYIEWSLCAQGSQDVDEVVKEKAGFDNGAHVILFLLEGLSW